MTNKEAIEHIKAAAKLAVDAGYSSDIVDACALAVRALEKEPCEDAISRQAAKRIIFDEFEGWPTDEEVTQLKRLTRQFNNLPSVNPQEPKTGHWIDCDVLQEVKCSECRMCFRNITNFCPNCGAKMESEERYEN